MAAVLGLLQPLAGPPRSSPPTPHGRIEATFRIGSSEAASSTCLSLGPHIEVVDPADLRAEVVDRIRQPPACTPIPAICPPSR